MSIRLPLSLLITLAVLGCALLGLSAYLQARQLDWLQNNPIWVNLLSGAIGFCFGLLILSLVVRRAMETNARKTLRVASIAAHNIVNDDRLQIPPVPPEPHRNSPDLNPEIAGELLNVTHPTDVSAALPDIEEWCRRLEGLRGQQGWTGLDAALAECMRTVRPTVERFRLSMTYESAIELLNAIRTGSGQLIEARRSLIQHRERVSLHRETGA